MRLLRKNNTPQLYEKSDKTKAKSSTNLGTYNLKQISFDPYKEEISLGLHYYEASNFISL